MYLEIFRISYVTPMPSTDRRIPRDGVDTVTPSHSAWSESSAACPRPRGRRRGGKKFGPGAFATLERVVFSCKGAERDEWRGPKGRADSLVILVLFLSARICLTAEKFSAPCIQNWVRYRGSKFFLTHPLAQIFGI